MTFAIPRLRLVLITIVVLSILPVVALVSWFITVQYKEEAMGHLYHYAVTVAANVASAEIDFIITENYASLQDSLLSFQEIPHVESITVVTPDGTIIADTHPEHLGNSLNVPTVARWPPDHKNTFVDFGISRAETLFPIRIGETTIGWCNILLDIGYIRDGIVAIQKKTMIAIGVGVVVVSALVFFFSAVVTRPLEEMMTAVAKVADGDFDQRARVAGVLEIRKLAEVFNVMTLAIKERENRLRQVQKMEAIGVLSSSIAHEFGNPLVGISFLLGDLKKCVHISEENQRLLDLGMEECRRMKKLIRDLKYFYRPSSGKKTSVNIHQLIDNIFLLQKSYLKSRNIEIIREYGENIPQVMAVEDQITQVLVNLLLNAAESMSTTGGTLTVGTGTDKETISVAIRDTGVGISEEDLEEIFLPFFSTKPEVTGTGLGLSVSYGIVKSHKGDISVSSSPGQGTTFTLTLPIVQE